MGVKSEGSIAVANVIGLFDTTVPGTSNPNDSAAAGSSASAARRNHTHGRTVEIDGWIPALDTWTYASATTFTIAGVDRTAIFTKGTRLKLTNSTVKYFVVVSSAFSTNTTVTVTGGSDYSLANAAISSPYYSYQASPAGYPQSFNWTPGFTGFSANPTPTRAIFWVIGNMCYVQYIGGTGTSNATTFTITGLPIAAVTSTAEWVLGHGTDNTTNFNANVTGNLTNGSTTLSLFKDVASAAWTNSGLKGVYNFTIAYPF